MRIEVTARRGPMSNVPIWTAFISENIKSRHWIQKSSSRDVRFTELQPYVFCDNYLPTRDARGRFEIKFTSRAGKAPIHFYPEKLLTGFSRRRWLYGRNRRAEAWRKMIRKVIG